MNRWKITDSNYPIFQYEIRLYTVVSQGQIHKLQKEKMYYVGGDMDYFGAEVKSSIDSIADR